MRLQQKLMIRILALIFLFLTGFFWLISSRNPVAGEVESRLKQKTVSLKTLKNLRISGEALASPAQLQNAYQANLYIPFWITEERISPESRRLLEAVAAAGDHGLNPAAYHARQIQAWLQSLDNGTGERNPDSLALLDILLTDAFFTYASHQYAGAVYGDGMNVHRIDHLKKISLRDSLLRAVEENKVSSVLMGFVNATPPYIKLTQKLVFYKQIAQNGGYPGIPNSPGDSTKIFTALCKRLSVTGELPQGYITDHYSPFLRMGIKLFQHSHGLDTTGLLNKATIEQLNIPVYVKVRQIELNMERCRWLPHTPTKEFVLVNIPGFFMEVQENYQTKLHMRAIVGKEFTQTPLFYAGMKHIVINPYWDVPFSIASKEILPILKKDPEYIHRNHMKVYTSAGAEVNPYAVNWSSYSSDYFPFKIRQVPGTWNSLGQIKFLFPNPYSVYLHGTPNPELFERDVRTFSHGCMRIENPVALAAYLLRNDKTWNEDRIRATIKTGAETWVRLADRLPVFVTYNTCWVDDNGVLHFRNDVYGHDNILARELYGDEGDLSLR